jgi:predicted phosphodiesterase
MKCLVVSDVHGNWPALQAVLAAERDADEVLCLGDLVNYGPQPAECVAWGMKLSPPSLVIQGNHDRDFAWVNDPHCAPANRPFAEVMSETTNSLLTLEMKRFLAALHPVQGFRWGTVSCVAAHLQAKGPLSCPFDHQNSQWPWESDIILVGLPEKLFTLVGHPDVLFVAHTHASLKTNWGTTLVVNPGSVGLPTDSDPRAGYAVWQDGEIELCRIAYDIEQTVRAYEPLNVDAQMKQQLVEGLRTGTGLPKHEAAEPAVLEQRGEPCHA